MTTCGKATAGRRLGTGGEADDPDLTPALAEGYVAISYITDGRLDFRLAPVPILGLDEVPLRALVVDETTGLPAGIYERLCRLASVL